MKFSKAIIAMGLLLSCNANAAVMCEGKIESVYKWHHMQFMSVLLGDKNGNRWISLPTKSDEAMALTAFAAGKHVKFYWSAADVTSCIDGWAHNRPFEGYFLVKAE